MRPQKTNIEFTVRETQGGSQAVRYYRAVGAITPCDIGHDREEQ